LISSFFVAISLLLIATFSFWYSSKLTLFKKPSFFYSFIVVLISFVMMGIIKIILSSFTSYAVYIAIFVYFLSQIIITNLLFKENLKKSIFTVLLAFVVTIIIGLPILVLAGIALTYLKMI